MLNICESIICRSPGTLGCRVLFGWGAPDGTPCGTNKVLTFYMIK